MIMKKKKEKGKGGQLEGAAHDVADDSVYVEAKRRTSFLQQAPKSRQDKSSRKGNLGEDQTKTAFYVNYHQRRSRTG